MLDWSKIDNDKTFQRLVNHLFALECNSPGFIPSSPYIGADGGWDGYYPYPHEGMSGIWSIQAKWTTKSFNDAVPSLKIKEELQKAKNNNANHLRIATNAELRVEQILELEKGNEGEVTTFKIWHREELTRRIELQPFLRYFFFGVPQYPKFVPWNMYFSEIEKHLLSASVTGISKFEDDLNKVKQFILSQNNNILLIQSPGGYGKSHLLREIAQVAHQIDSDRQVWMIKPGFRKMDDSLQDEIIDRRKYLLLFDDSDRFKDEIKPLLSFVKHNNKNNFIKVILSLRTSGLQAIHEIIKELRCEELSDEINISNWSNIDLIQLLRLAVEQQKVEDEERIVKAYPNPYLIVWIGKKIKNEPTLEFGKIKEKFVNEIDYEAEQCLKDFLSPSEVKDFLTNLACIIPFSKENATVLGVLSSQFNLNQDKLRKALEILKKVGILRIVGRSLRFNPDMKGDLYLAYMVTTDTKMLERLIFIWQSVPVSWDSFEGIFINLDAAARYSDSTAFRNTLSKIVDSWIEKAASATGFERRYKLTQATKIANTVPENCLNLLAVYLESSAPLSNDTTLTALGCGDITLTSDDYGPLIIKLIRIPNIRREDWVQRQTKAIFKL